MAIRQISSNILEYNHASLKSALKELGIDFIDGPQNFVMPCFIEGCTGHKNPMYLRASNGVFHCFRCGTKGDFEKFVRLYTGWGEMRVMFFCSRHRAYDDPQDKIESNYKFETLTDEVLAKFAFRHDYCYDRKLTEATLRRYKIGYDREENMVTFPWFDRVGKLAAIKKRSVSEKYYKFMAAANFQHVLFGINLIRPKNVVWLAEGEFDAMYLDQCFHEYNLTDHGAVALGGKDLHQPALDELMMKAPTFIVLATDSDDDGSKAADKIAKMLTVPSFRMAYPDGVKDPNDCPSDWIVQEATQSTAVVAAHDKKIEARYGKWLKENTST